MTAFLSLPVELRLDIYQIHLQETIIRIPGPQLDLNALSFLLTCHLIHSEAFPLVPSTVTYSIYCTEYMVYFLSSLPPSTLQSLRHITLWATPIGLYENYPTRDYYRTYFFSDILPAFPGLQLDTLTVRDAYHGPFVTEYPPGHSATGMELGELIQKGRGWKELRYLSPNRRFLEMLEIDKPGLVWPKQWDDDLKKRDGKRSGASVKILLGKEIRDYVYAPPPYNPGTWNPSDSDDEDAEEAKGCLIDPEDVYWEHVDEMAPWREEDYTVHEEEVPTGPDGERRPVLVVARRGKDADIVEDGSGIELKIKNLLEVFKGDWKRMKRKDVLVNGHRDAGTML